jgi:hypothetical protein
MCHGGLHLGGYCGEGESRVLDQGGGGQATLAEREDQEWELKTEVESAVSLAFVRGDTNKFARKVALLEGDVTNAH